MGNKRNARRGASRRTIVKRLLSEYKKAKQSGCPIIRKVNPVNPVNPVNRMQVSPLLPSVSNRYRFLPSKNCVWRFFETEKVTSTCKLCHIRCGTIDPIKLFEHLNQTHAEIYKKLKEEKKQLESIKGQTTAYYTDKSNCIINNALLYMMTKDNLTSNFLEHQGFLHFLQIARPNFTVPSTSLVDNWMEICYTGLQDIIATNLTNDTTVSLSIYLHTVQETKFMMVSAHFIFDQKLTSICLGAQELTDLCLTNINSIIDNMVTSFGINKDRVIAVTIESEPNMTRAVNLCFRPGIDIPCINRTINALVQKSLDTIEYHQTLVKKVRNIITFIMGSKDGRELLRVIQISQNITEPSKLTLNDGIKTPWKSTYNMLNKFKRLAPIVETVLETLNCDNTPLMLTAVDLQILADTTKLLFPFIQVKRELLNEQHVTGSSILPTLYSIRQSVNNKKLSQLVSEKLQKNLVIRLENKLNELEKNKILSKATLLDPRFKEMYSTASNSSSFNFIMNNAQDVQNAHKRSYSDAFRAAVIKSQLTVNLKYILWSCNEPNPDQVKQLRDSLKPYFAEPCIARTDDPISYWTRNKSSNGQAISKVALQTLIVKGTAIPSKDVLSTLDVLASDRQKFTSQQIYKRLFLASLSPEMWQKL